ncbi:unnamed protein product [Prorocentrum cordatum]|uniref:Dynein light chain n=1 Tax=Prorocentrum cordatum TaxID=2364126 RepID=A0ABN9UZC5_9DINO|nr:unnamed protein product [Polarella glacialis]
MADRKAVIKNADMAEDMQQDAIDCATQALEKYNIEKDIAAFIKKEFDKKYNPTWHAIVGSRWEDEGAILPQSRAHGLLHSPPLLVSSPRRWRATFPHVSPTAACCCTR